MILEDVSQGMTFEGRSECSEGGSLMAVWRRAFLEEGRTSTKVGAPESGLCLQYRRNSKESLCCSGL